MNKATFYGLALIWLWIIGIALGLHYLIVYEPAAIYDIKKANHWLAVARSSIDLNEIADYMEKAYQEIEHRHGNPCWWYPTSKTDFDINKDLMQNNIDLARSVASNSTSSDYGYQRCVDNVQEMILDLEAHLSISAEWTVFITVPNIVIWIVFILLNVALIIKLLIVVLA